MGYPLVEDLTTLHNTTQDAFTILDQRSAGLHSSGLGAIPVLDQMFNRQQPQQPQNAGSDSAWYQQRYEDAHCDKYLCPHTLSCVHFPHHCPCAFPEVEDKIEFGDGSMACVSKGG